MFGCKYKPISLNTIIYDREIMLNKEKTLVEIGLRIRELRERRKLSIQEFADKLEIEYNNVIRIEKGRTNFTIGTLVKIANALDLSLRELLP